MEYKMFHGYFQTFFPLLKLRFQPGLLLKYVLYNLHWRPTKVETTGATLNFETLISRLFETFLDFETKKQVVPRHAGTP